jgi:hypothetical protein
MLGGVAAIAAVWSLAAFAAYVPITFRPYFWEGRRTTACRLRSR